MVPRFGEEALNQAVCEGAGMQTAQSPMTTRRSKTVAMQAAQSLIGTFPSESGSTAVEITEELMLAMAVIIQIPILMIYLSRSLKYRVNRWANTIDRECVNHRVRGRRWVVRTPLRVLRSCGSRVSDTDHLVRMEVTGR
jgi:hypothetical protein